MRNPCRRCFLHGSGAGWWKTLFTMFPKGPLAKKKLPYCADDFRAADTLQQSWYETRGLAVWVISLDVCSRQKVGKQTHSSDLLIQFYYRWKHLGDSMAVATQTSTLMLHAKCCIFLFELKSWNMPQFARYPQAVALEIGTLSKHLKHTESHKWHGIMLCACPGQGVRCAVCLQQATKIFHTHFWKLQCRDSSVKTPL